MSYRRRALWAFLVLALLSVGIRAFWIEPGSIHVTHLSFDSDWVPPALKGLTAVHLTDLHITRFGPQEQELLCILRHVEPDFIFLTGDYIDWDGEVENALHFLSLLNAKIGVWAVLGDYDYSANRNSCRFCHEGTGGLPTTSHSSVHFLRNSEESVHTGKGWITIAGADRDASCQGLGKPESVGSSDRFHILLSHDPLLFDALEGNAGVLVLAGDTHGGQVPLPSWLWGLLGYKKNARYNQGLFERGGRKMYVSRGIGTSHLPVRFLRPPECAVIQFR